MKAENIQGIIKDVEKRKEDIAVKNTEILTLQHQNVVLQEQTYIQKVEEEFDEGDIDESIIQLHKKQGKIMNPPKYAYEQEENDEDKERKNQPEISDLRVLEGIQNYLDKQIQKFDRFRMMRQLNLSPNKNKNGQGNNGNNNLSSDSSSSDDEDENGSDSNNTNENINSHMQLQGKSKKQSQTRTFNPFICIQVRYKSVKQGEIAEGSKVVISFRVEEKTKFSEIKKAACQYWSVKDPNSKEGNGFFQQGMSKDDSYSFMDLCDETNSTLPDNQFVIQFLMQKGYKNLNQTTLVLRQKELRTGLESQQNECTKITKGIDQQKQQGQYYVTRVQVNQINPYEYFFQEYPSLKFYIEQKQLIESDQQDNPQEDKLVLQQGISDSHCCIILFILSIITVTALFLSKMIDVEVKYQTNEYFERTMKINDKYYDLTKENLLDQFVSDILGDCFFDSPNDNPQQGFFKDNFELIGNLRLRFQKQQLKECDIYSDSSNRFACFDLNTVELIKTDIGNNQKYQFQKFQNGPKDESQRMDLEGTFGTYGPQGYIFDFNGNLSREEYRFQIDYLKSVIQGDDELRVLIITFTLYNPSIDIWVNANIIIERDRFGELSPYKPTIYFFKPNIYDGDDGKVMIALDIIRLISTCILFVFVMNQMNSDKSYIFSILGFLNLAVISFSVASLVLSTLQYRCGFEEQTLFDMPSKYIEDFSKIDTLSLKDMSLNEWIEFQNSHFVDTTYVAFLYNSLQSIQAVLITILLFRLIFVFSFSIYLKAIVETIKNAGNDLMKYFVIFLPLLISFAFIFYQLWGSKVFEFTSLTKACCSVILMTIGYMPIDSIYQVDSVWSIIYILLYYLMIIFLLFTFIMGILIESQHSTIMKKGYPQMQKSPISGVLIFKWLLQWVPQRIQKEFETILLKFKGKDTPTKVDTSLDDLDEKKPLVQKSPLKASED